MKRSNWLSWLQRGVVTPSRRRNRKGPAPATTALESRFLLTTMYVDNNYAITNDTGTAGLSTGDTVTFAPGEASEVTGLTFGTNAFSSISTAQTAASAGDVVRVGTGTFAHTGQLNITKDITITGSGQDATILMRQGNNTASENRTIEVQTSGVTFEDLTFGGWEGTVTTGFGYHVWLNNADNATFDNVRFDASKPMRVAMYVGGSGNADNLTVTDSRFTGTYYRATIRGGGEGMTITGNTFEELHHAGSDAISEAYSSIYMEYAGNVSGVISGNYFAAGVLNTITPHVNNQVNTITNWRTVGTAGLTVSHNTFDLQDNDLLGANGFVPTAFYSDPALVQANAITVQDNIFRGYNYSGTQPATAPQFRPGMGQFGGALEFDGVNDFGTFNFGSNELGDQGTISLWVKMDNTTRRNQIIEGPGNGAGLELQYRNNTGGQIYSTPYQPGGDFVIRAGNDATGLGAWTNIQVIYDFAGLPGAEGGGKLRIFRNGVESAYLTNFTPTDLSWASIASTVNGVMNLGRDPGDNTRFFDGMMDDVAWYDSVLSAAERTAIRTSGVAADARLVAHWNLDDAAGVTAVTGNNGTGVTLNLGAPSQGGAIVSSAGTVVSYNLFHNNDVNFNPAVTDGGNNLTGDPKFLGIGPFQHGVDDPLDFYIIQANSPAAGTASDATNRGASQSVNQAPTAIALQNVVSTLPEDTSTVAAIKLADIVVTDDGFGTNILGLSGSDAVHFEIVGTELRLKAGTTLDFETKSIYSVFVTVDDPNLGSTPDTAVSYSLTITDANDPPSAVDLQNTVTTLAENTSTVGGIKLADIVVTDDAFGTEVYYLSGADMASFEIVGTELRLVSGVILDFESKPSYSITVNVDDLAVGSTPDVSVAYTLMVSDVNEAPTAVALQNATTTLSESTSTVAALTVADIAITDDALGTETVTLTGADAALFEVAGSELRLKAGAVLDFETNPLLEVTVEVDDSTLGGSPDVSASLSINITDALEAGESRIIDDGDAGFALTGTWSNLANFGYSPTPGTVSTRDAKVATSTASGTKVATWTFTGLPAGEYRVDATWLSGADRASNTPYVIRDGVGGAVLGNLSINQRVNPTGAATAGGRPFQTFGTFTITGSTLVVELSNTAVNGAVIADAMRVTSLAPTPMTPELEVLDGVNGVSDNGAVDFGSISRGSVATKTFTVRNIGTADLVLQPIVVTGAAFSLTSPNFTSGQVLGAGQQVTFTIALATGSNGSFTGTVSFANTDADEGPFNFALAATVVDPPAAGGVIIDDGDAGFALTGSWSNVAGFGFGADAKAASNVNSGTKVATWTLAGLTAGQYRVDATWLSGTDRASNAPYVIRDGVGGPILGTLSVNQRVNPTGATSSGGRPFQTLGTFTITGSTLVIELSNTATNGAVIADAMRITALTPPPDMMAGNILDGVNTGGTIDFGAIHPGSVAYQSVLDTERRYRRSFM